MNVTLFPGIASQAATRRLTAVLPSSRFRAPVRSRAIISSADCPNLFWNSKVLNIPCDCVRANISAAISVCSTVKLTSGTYPDSSKSVAYSKLNTNVLFAGGSANENAVTPASRPAPAPTYLMEPETPLPSRFDSPSSIIFTVCVSPLVPTYVPVITTLRGRMFDDAPFAIGSRPVIWYALPSPWTSKGTITFSPAYPSG